MAHSVICPLFVLQKAARIYIYIYIIIQIFFKLFFKKTVSGWRTLSELNWSLMCPQKASKALSGQTCLSVWHSVPERASYGTEYACRAQKGFLGYATHHRKHSVRKTGFYGTEEIFGAKNRLLGYATRFLKPSAQNRLLRYGRDIRCQKQPPLVRDASSKARRTADSTDCGQPPAHRTHLQCAKRPPLGGD